MSRYIGYLVLLISLYASGVVSASVECEEPECPLFESIMLPHPTDCSKFIYCDNGAKVVETCQAGLHFNPIEYACDWPEFAGCVKCETGATEVPTTEVPTTEEPTTEEPTTEVPTTEVPTTEVSTTEGPTTEGPTTEGPTTENPTTTDGTITTDGPETCEVPACPELIDNQFLFLSVPWSCVKYVMCLNGNIFNMSCADNLIFDENAQTCVIPPQGHVCVTCEIDVTTIEPETEEPELCEVQECPETQETPLYLAVPWDCSQLVLCIRGQTFEQTCGSGLHFSPEKQTCVLPENTVCDVCEQIEVTTELEVTTEPPVAECKLASCYSIIEYFSVTPVPWNCRQFVECYMGAQTIYECPNGWYFDVIKKNCNVENVSNCVPCQR